MPTIENLPGSESSIAIEANPWMGLRHINDASKLTPKQVVFVVQPPVRRPMPRSFAVPVRTKGGNRVAVARPKASAK